MQAPSKPGFPKAHPRRAACPQAYQGLLIVISDQPLFLSFLSELRKSLLTQRRVPYLAASMCTLSTTTALMALE